MQNLAKRLNIQHDFSTANCASSNGPIERVMRDLPFAWTPNLQVNVQKLRESLDIMHIAVKEASEKR